MTRLAQRLSVVQPSASIEISGLAAKMRAEGIDVISLSQGEPDFETPAAIREAAKAALDAGATRYTDVDGTPALKQAIVEKFRRDNGLAYRTDEISVGAGGKQVIFNALMALVDPGDEVIFAAPHWVSYPDMVRLAGGTPVAIRCPAESGFKLTPAKLEDAITPRTRVLILNSPGNPSGAGYTRDELVVLAAVLLDHPDIVVLTDDIYEYLVYDDFEFCTLAEVEPRLKSRTLTINGVSKGHAMTGWRIGFGAGPADLIKAMAVMQSQTTSNPASVSQAAAVVALGQPLDDIRARNVIFAERRGLCFDALNATRGLTCRMPEGAFYLFPNCEGLLGRRTPTGETIDDDKALARYLLTTARVAVVPGSAFGLPGHFRISFASDTERLLEACRRIDEACLALQ
ncbi:pyridoxal phosphate-dependent aminotransferase [Salinicola corii]|uniref:Aminotransferase n=1 Tax=Salinicola corii TaxID=2606937 RepID=A0A640WDS9_9GAMM|nr:pyridoxal phosphate-dependent aminotransferase [Salinicola corii]KAA0018134.1 pyridoxal phosphate-dependent aminotransferase [Salinicola corii]